MRATITNPASAMTSSVRRAAPWFLSLSAIAGLAHFAVATEPLVTENVPKQSLPAEPRYAARLVFAPDEAAHGHVHASSVVVCPNGDLRLVWYENGVPLPDPPYYSQRKDKSADVRIAGSRLAAGALRWETPYVMSDTFGVSDNNPCLVVDAQQRLWLFHSTMLGAPRWTWGSSLLQYKISEAYQTEGPPQWHRSGIVIPQPVGLAQVIEPWLTEAAQSIGASDPERAAQIAELRRRQEDPIFQRLGWMPRAHPLLRHDGAILLPLSNENFEIPVVAITQDMGATWQFSAPVPAVGLIQPSLVELPDQTLLAFFRNGDPRHRIQQSQSHDGGLTWSPPTLTDRPHPGSGLEVIRLANGHLLLVYNNNESGPRDHLAVSISEDFGKTWPWTRQLEAIPGGRFDYPSVAVDPRGLIHVTYSYDLKSIKHVTFNEAWVQSAQHP